MLFYKRPEIANALVEESLNKEITARFNDKFGKRPDTLTFPSDVFTLADKGASSFHCSEEIWSNPLQIVTGMSKKELNELRIGWDLIIDIDCKIWEYSKLITHLIVKALKHHGVKNIAVKFSGNKGFHIGVPFESFPSEINNEPTKNLFPELPRKIATYLTYYIDSPETDFELSRLINVSNINKIKEIAEKIGTKKEELIKNICPDCLNIAKKREDKTKFICPKCGKIEESNSEHKTCDKCKIFMNKQELSSKKQCSFCNSTSPSIKKFNTEAILEVDTVLLASRHLYRMTYSLHEKSGLASIPIDNDKILEFNKSQAQPSLVKVRPFLEREKSNPKETIELIKHTLSFSKIKENKTPVKEWTVPTEAIPNTLFPPCIVNILKGMKDGKKRALFILINFLKSAGYKYSEVEQILYEWNKKNPDPLRETYLKGQLSAAKRTQPMPPPNCANTQYKDLLICQPNNLCKLIRNPISYSFRQKSALNNKIEDEEKEKRRLKREKKKEEKIQKFKEQLAKEKLEKEQQDNPPKTL